MFASGGAKFTKMGHSLPWTPMNRRAKFALLSAEKSVTVQTNKQTNKQTVTWLVFDFLLSLHGIKSRKQIKDKPGYCLFFCLFVLSLIFAGRCCHQVKAENQRLTRFVNKTARASVCLSPEV